MFPIGGLVFKEDHTAPWVVYARQIDAEGRERYEMLGALPPYPTPNRPQISAMFTD